MDSGINQGKIFVYSQFCYNACFENANLFKYNWYIKEKQEYNADFAFDRGWFYTGEILEEGRKLHPAEPSCIRIHEAEKREKKKKKTRNNLFHNQRESTICMQRL